MRAGATPGLVLRMGRWLSSLTRPPPWSSGSRVGTALPHHPSRKLSIRQALTRWQMTRSGHTSRRWPSSGTMTGARGMTCHLVRCAPTLGAGMVLPTLTASWMTVVMTLASRPRCAATPVLVAATAAKLMTPPPPPLRQAAPIVTSADHVRLAYQSYLDRLPALQAYCMSLCCRWAPFSTHETVQNTDPEI